MRPAQQLPNPTGASEPLGEELVENTYAPASDSSQVGPRHIFNKHPLWETEPPDLLPTFSLGGAGACFLPTIPHSQIVVSSELAPSVILTLVGLLQGPEKVPNV